MFFVAVVVHVQLNHSYYIDAKVFGLFGVRNVIAPKGQ